MSTHVHVAATPARAWEVLGDFGSVHRWVPALSRSSMVDGAAPAVGARRVCSTHGFGTVEEEITAWEDGRSFSYRMVPSGIFESAHNTWRIVADPDGKGCTVESEAAFRLRFGALGRALYALVLERQIRRMSERTMASLKQRIESNG